MATSQPASRNIDTLRAKRDAAQQAFNYVWSHAQRDGPSGQVEKVCTWSLRWMESELELAQDLEDRVASLESHRERVIKCRDELFKHRHPDVTRADVAAGTYFAEDAALRLAGERRKHRTHSLASPNFSQ